MDLPGKIRNVSRLRAMFLSPDTQAHHFLLLATFVATATIGIATGEESLDYNRDIRPLLSKACFRCHGPDEAKREAKLRLDIREEALAKDAIVPGDPNASELILRITSEDPDEIMPPPEDGDPLSAEEIALLTQWVKSDAPYAKHWAFEGPVRPEVSEDEPSMAIDELVGRQLEKEKMAPAPPATKETWLRRVTFDLTGLPPTEEEIDAFLADESGGAYETVVDRLLASSAYGERMAQDWLDLARYADTYGRHEDANCITWPYRDWVIRAFNENLPYDDFITWQTAGDLLPNPTRDQMIATCFNRLPQQSNEAGSDPEEFRIEQVADRVHTNATAFLGLTMECARCHDHKYDPLTMRDYYSMSAFFNNIDELGLFAVFTGGVPAPSIILFDDAQEERLAEIEASLGELEAKLDEIRPEAEERFAEWLEEQWPPIQRSEPGFWGKVARFLTPDPPPTSAPTDPLVFLKFEEYKKDKKFKNEFSEESYAQLRRNTPLVDGRVGKAIHWQGDNHMMVQAFDEISRNEPFSMAMWLQPLAKFDRASVAHRCASGIDSASRGFELIIEDGKASFALSHFAPGNEIRIRSREEIPLNEWTHIAATYDGSSKAAGMALYWNGRKIEDPEIVRDHLYKDIVYRDEWGDVSGKDNVHLGLALAGRHNDASYRDGYMDELYFFDRELTAPEIHQLALLPDDSEPEDWFAWYLREHDEPWREILAEIEKLRGEENEISGNATELMVMKEMPGPRRPTHLLHRGEFNQPQEEMSPDTPTSLSPFPADAARDRLGFAHWLVSPENPLVSRVAVNRIWQQFFQRGLVGTSEDFGTQGEYPANPELLDWLAIHFREDIHWDTKALCREIVLSDTYRQSSIPADPAYLEKDPENRFLARGPRGRLPAESIRDMALFVSGLLNPEIGGPSVKPYQPVGLWHESGTQHIYVQDTGDKLYRRSLYTFWRRTLPPPSMTIFDAPTREFCTARRPQTHTPLQALVLMNDPQFIEAARVMAESLVREFPDDGEARASSAFRQLTGQQPTGEQLSLLTDFLAKEREDRAAEPDLAKTFLESNGERPVDESLPTTEVAATTGMIRLLFGFSETVMKP